MDGQIKCGQILERISRDPSDHILKVSGQYHDLFFSFKVVLKLSDHGQVWSWQGEVRFPK